MRLCVFNFHFALWEATFSRRPIVSTSSCNCNSSHWNMATGFGERPVQQVLVFFLFFWTTTSNENKLLGGARDARKRVIKLTRTRYWAAPKGRGKNEWQRQQILDCAEVRGERINDKQQKSNCKQQQQGRTTEMGGLRWCAGLVPCARELLPRHQPVCPGDLHLCAVHQKEQQQDTDSTRFFQEFSKSD